VATTTCSWSRTNAVCTAVLVAWSILEWYADARRIVGEAADAAAAADDDDD
jgi:hypothetical protein